MTKQIQFPNRNSIESQFYVETKFESPHNEKTANHDVAVFVEILIKLRVHSQALLRFSLFNTYMVKSVATVSFMTTVVLN